MALIEGGGPFPYSDDGETFLNSAGLLPAREPGYYRVYTVETPGSVEPTSRRIVTGTDGELYWTDDLYTIVSGGSRNERLAGVLADAHAAPACPMARLGPRTVEHRLD